jgi:hypothetical protein
MYSQIKLTDIAMYFERKKQLLQFSMESINCRYRGLIWNSPLTYNFAYSGKVKLKNERYSSWNAATLLCFTEEIRKLHPRSTRLADSTLTITPSMWFRSTCGIAWTSKQPIDVCMSTSKRHYGHMFIFYMRIRFDGILKQQLNCQLSL